MAALVVGTAVARMTPVVLRKGVSVDWDVAQVLMAVEDRGGVFSITDGAIRVQPPGLLTREEKATLMAHKPEVLRILTYEPD